MKLGIAKSFPGLNLVDRSSAMPAPLTSARFVLVDRPQDGPRQIPRRAKIWELSRYLHCSVIGTCLSTAELRQVLSKSGFSVDGICDHDLHGKGVTIAGQPDVAGKLLNKALDKRHRQAIGQFAKAKNSADLSGLWKEARGRGDIPGAYWAALTHPEASDDLVRQLFGEVHMLSHLVGAANRADIRRLTDLEAENAALREKLHRQEAHIREGIAARDAKINELNQLLARRIAEAAKTEPTGSGPAANMTLTTLVTDLEHRLSVESRRRSALEARFERLTANARKDREAFSASRVRESAFRDELAALEASVTVSASASQTIDGRRGLSGVVLLYVGGRPQLHAHLRGLADRIGADILFHDGGIEDRQGLLAGMISRADAVMFPVDCVSHEAALAVKRLCRNSIKPFVPLRTSGISSFVAALERMNTAKAVSELATPGS